MAIGFQVTFDACDPAALARFWGLALQYVDQPPPPGFSSWDEFAEAAGIPDEDRGDLASVVDPAGEGPRLLFQRVPEGKTAKNRVHLDVNAGGDRSADEDTRRSRVEQHAALLIGAGGSEVQRHQRHDEFWVVMRDPEGNEFCIQ